MNITQKLITGLISLFVISASVEAIEIGEKILETSTPLKATTGKQITLQNVKGAKGTLVIFSCNQTRFIKKRC